MAKNEKFSKEVIEKLEAYRREHNVSWEVLNVVTAVTGFEFEDLDEEEQVNTEEQEIQKEHLNESENVSLDENIEEQEIKAENETK